MGKKKRSAESPKQRRADENSKKERKARPGAGVPSRKAARAEVRGPAGPHPAAGAGVRRGGDVGDVLAELADTTDPEARYRLATDELAAHVQAIERLSSIRADAVASAYASSGSVRVLAQRLGVSSTRVHQLIQESKARASDRGV